MKSRLNKSSKILNSKKSEKTNESPLLASKASRITNENFNNDNIFKGDVYYKINGNLSFDSSLEEQNCKRNILYRYLNLFNPLLIYQIIACFYKLIFNWATINTFFSILYIPNLALLAFSLLMINKFDKSNSSTYQIRWFLELDNILDIISSTILTGVTNNMLIPVKFCYGVLYNSVLCLPLDQTLPFFLIEFLTVLAFIGYPDGFFLTRIFYNLFSWQSIFIILSICIIIAMQYFFCKSQRELWALYDSFKRSFINMRHVYDDFPFPVLIISKKSPNVIHYKNLETDALYARVKQMKQIDKTSATGKSYGRIK